MPVRSINLKIVVPRSGDRAAAQALWTTHAEVNAAVAYYERLLLACRQTAYRMPDREVTEAEQTEAALQMIRAARLSNARAGLASDEQALGLLRQLYVDIVPTATGGKGDAQRASGYLSPLCDAASKGFTSIFAKIGQAPNWLEGVRSGEVDALEAAAMWLAGPEGKARLKATGAPARWQRLARAGDQSWPFAFVDDFDRKSAEASGTPALMQALREAGLLPLFPPFFGKRIEGVRGGVTPWDRLAIRLAVGHLLSWESWCTKAAADHAKRRERLESFMAQQIVGSMAAQIEVLRGYEVARLAELSSQTGLEAADMRITFRTIRAWPELRGKWQGISEPSQLLDIIAQLQTRLRGRFGDPHLYAWLAQPANHHLWKGGSDPVSTMARLNSLEAVVARSRETANMTLPDARRHPRAAQWEAEGGANLRNYRLRMDERGRLDVGLPLLACTGGGGLREAQVSLALAPSRQLRKLELATADGKTVASYLMPTGERASAVLGSADLLVERAHLSLRAPEAVGAGDIGSMWLKLSLDIRPLEAVGDVRKAPPALHHFQSALSTRSRHMAKVEPGFRVLSVDLGVRTFASCSVFELKAVPPESRLAFPVAELRMWAEHERSFRLELPDEAADRRRQAARDAAHDQLDRFRHALARYRSVRSMGGLADGDDRLQRMAELRERMAGQGLAHELQLLEALSLSVQAPLPVWNGELEKHLREARHAFGLEIAGWRQRTRARGAERMSGKSVWSIEYFTKLRRFLQGWSLLSGKGEIMRLDRARWGSFASRLLAHIDGMKEDRLKTGSDLIVQAARGYLRDDKGQWVKAHQPCHVILFEDLARYRMRTDRPRRENSQLMLWSHRGIRQEAGLQAELYGIHAAETGAAFSSRYHASRLTPGIRAHAVTLADLASTGFADRLQREGSMLDTSALRPGDLVPSDGGGVFVCLGRRGIHRIHADINAAQNLQRRFWTRHGEAFRIVARGLAEGERRVWMPRQMGKRLLGALGGYGLLEPTGSEDGACRWVPVKGAVWRRHGGGEAEQEGGEDPDDYGIDSIEEELLEGTGEIVVFFRDPSGVVFPDDLWLPSRAFWSAVKWRTAAAMRNS